MRSREFIMKDGYSFHYDENDLIKTYNDIKNSYNNIFKSLGIKAVPVQADSGEIGGNASHEFQITCDNGEDILCIDGEKTYNIELAPSAKVYEALEHEITFYSGCYQGKNIGLLVSKTDKINRQKIDNLLISKLKESEFDSNLEMYFVDNALKNCKKFTHLSNAVNILNLNDVKFHDLRNVKENEITPNNNKYKFAKGIEVAHIFQLGDFYSKSFGIKVKEKTPLMGCYGIGVSRIVAAAIEQSHDDKGIIWSYELSPYKIHIVAIDYQKNDSVKIHADEIYNSLKKITDVILDDSHANAGNKMSDANLMGCYLQVIVGPKALAEQKVQLKFRKNQKTKMIEVSNLLNELTEIINHPSLLEKW
jgi:prolyl-tRNA synthetase